MVTLVAVGLLLLISTDHGAARTARFCFLHAYLLFLLVGFLFVAAGHCAHFRGGGVSV